LGSGAARGWAHIGVLEALNEAHIPVDFIAGTSIGSFVGAIYSAGELNSLKEFALQMDWKAVLSYFDVVFPRSGFLDGKKVHNLFTMHTDAITFNDLHIPMKMVATDLKTGDKVIMNSGDLVEAIRASISMPGIFTPVRKDGFLLIDGGAVDPVPVGVVRSMGAEVVIAVDLNSGLVHRHDRRKKKKSENIPSLRMEALKKNNEIIQRMANHYENAGQAVKSKIGKWLNREEPTPNIMEVIGTSLSIMQEKITKVNLAIDAPDILIQPDLADLKLFDFDQAERAIQEGYKKTMAAMDEIRARMEA
ncbi:MAG: patatin-like phospholipase family protein, partial [FCB group bacterium]|nr:patatin-like phospholipase family protein [FCB group bacterium]